MKITSAAVSKLPFVEKGQKLHMDDQLKGFGVRIGTQQKTYFVQRDINRKTCRVTIGAHGVFTADQARKKAQELLVQLANGENPNEEKRKKQAESITLGEATDLYLKSPKKRSKITKDAYRINVDKYLADWKDRPLKEINRKMVKERHLKIGNNNGPYVANYVMRTFRAIYNRAMRQHEELPPNPIINVDMFPEKRRQEPIPVDELPTWYADVSTLSNPIRRDYNLFVLFTGIRRTDALTVRWEDVDLEKGKLHRPNPKGGEERAFTVPLSDYLIELLKQRKEGNEPFFPNSPWVFPANTKKGHVTEPKERSIKWSPHRLRDTYTTAANSAGLSPYDIESLTNHRPPKSTVTAGYINQGVEGLRVPQQKVTDYLLEKIGIEK